MTDELIDKRIGGYTILDVIGQGGMATVYRAHQVSMNRTVALKVLPRQFLRDDTYLQRFNREVKIISQLEHRNIVPVHDYGEHDGQPYIVMRYMSGGSVDDLLKDGPLTLDQMVGILSQIAPALDYAHSKNVLHRDIKPSNVLLDDDGGAYLTDFGIARILGDNSGIGNITTQGVVGTPSYMSPEQAQGHPSDQRSDIYSLGVMLFEMATGKRPFESDTPYSIAVMQVTQPPPPPRSINPNISPALEQVIYKAMSKQPAERYSSATTFAEALEAVAFQKPALMSDTQPGGIPISQAYTPPPTPAYYPTPTPGAMPPAIRRKRRPNLLISAAVGGLLGCGLLAVLLVGAVIIISNIQLQNASGPPNTPVSTSSSPTELPTIDNAEIPNQGGADVTPAATNMAPLGMRETLAVGEGQQLPDAQILYFAERDRNYDVYILDLTSGQDRRLTTDPGIDMYPQVSPDGSKIVFVSNRDGDYDLYLMNPDGSDVVSVLQTSVNERIPAWSADGSWIYFSSDTRDDGSHDIYRIRPDGGDLSLLYTDGLRNSHPRPSSDELLLVFTNGSVTDEDTWDIGSLNQQTGSFTLLTDNTIRDSSPLFTPDGASIVYIMGGEGTARIMLMNPDGSDQRLLYDAAGDEWGASFSPDMAYLLFTSNATGADELFIYDLMSGIVQQLTNTGGMYGSWMSYNSG